MFTEKKGFLKCSKDLPDTDGEPIFLHLTYSLTNVVVFSKIECTPPLICITTGKRVKYCCVLCIPSNVLHKHQFLP